MEAAPSWHMVRNRRGLYIATIHATFTSGITARFFSRVLAGFWLTIARWKVEDTSALTLRPPVTGACIVLIS